MQTTRFMNPAALITLGLGMSVASSQADDLRVLGLLAGPRADVPIVDIAAGTYHAIGRDADGLIHVWGPCLSDAAGDPCGVCDPPTDFGGGRQVVALAAGSLHAMALLDDGAVACWGCEPEACDVPDDLREAPPDPVVAIAAGEGHSLALLASGELRCWGRATNAGADSCEIPGGIPPGNPPVEIAATRGFSVALLADGSIVQWGDGFVGVPEAPVESLALVESQAGDGESQPRLVCLLADGSVWFDGIAHAIEPGNPCVAVTGGAWPAAILTDETVRFLVPEIGSAPFPLPGLAGIEPWRATQVVGGRDFLLSIAVPEDCDGNGVPDREEIAADPSLDCNGSGRLDVCDRRRSLEWAGGFDVEGVSRSLTAEPPIVVPAEFSVIANGDLSTQAEHLVVEFNGRVIATLFADSDVRDDCVPRTASFSISPKTWSGGGTRTLTIRSSEAVDPDLCADSGFLVLAELGQVVEDCNVNGIDDGCEVLAGTAPDIDGDLRPDECAPDCDLDGVPDAWAVFQREVEDCDGDAEPDSCAVADGSLPDCNGNGRPDGCDLADGTLTDTDGNGWPDECDLVPGDLDFDGCVGAADLGILLSLWTATDQPDADLDGDGVVQAGDLGLLLVHWGECL